MKKLEIKTEKATLLVVDLPTCKTHLFYKGYYVMDSSDKGLNDKCRKISQGDTQEFYHIGVDCKYIGKASEITEEEWNNIVYYDVEFDIDEMEPSTTSKEIEIIYYNDYVNKTLFGDCTTATESGLSLLKANGVVMDYDFDDCPNDFCENGRIDVGYNESMTCSLCEEEQAKVWSNPHVFIKVD